MYFPARLHRPLSLLVGYALIVLLTACGSSTPATTSATPAPSVAGGSLTTPATTASPGTGTTPVPTPVVTTVPVPPTQTACPAAGMGRAAVPAPLALGPHPNVVYTVTSQQTTTTIMRYDAVTGSRTQIFQVAHEHIGDVQVSADGQWLLFVASPTDEPDKLQLIRLDGQGLQTLYCGSVALAQWSTDQQRLIFWDGSVGGGGALDLLNTRSGSVQHELIFSSPFPAYLPVTWLDTTRLYLDNPGVDAPANSIYMLDTTKGANQTPGDLIQVFHVLAPGTGSFDYVNFDSSYDGKTLFACQYANQRGSSGGSAPPSAIGALPAAGGAAHTLFMSSTLAISRIRVVNSASLFLLVENLAVGETGQNGLWKINTDGSNLTRLAPLANGTVILLNQTSQFPWSNFSRDSSFYAVLFSSSQGLHTIDSLEVGPLHGGAPTTFASADAGTTQFAIAGWTTM